MDLGKSVNLQELEGAECLTTSDTECWLLQMIKFHLKWHLEGGLNVDKGQCKDKQINFLEQ